MNEPWDPVQARLTPFVRDALAGLEHDVTDRRPPMPDLADAVARAHALDGMAVPAAWVESAGVVELGGLGSGAVDTGGSAALDSFLGDVRAHVEIASAERRLRPVVPPKRGARVRVLVATLSVAVAAAAMVLFFPSFGQLTSTMSLDDDDVAPAEAADVVDVERPELEAREASKRPRKRPGRPVTSTPPAEAEEPVEIIEIVEAEEPKPPADSRRHGSLDDLEKDAARLWKAGDLRGAARKLEQVIARTGKTRRAELAFGDLFTISYQLDGPKRRNALFKRYLQRFPGGRYADDARAGLCRAAKRSSATKCWSGYLEDFGSGAHRLEAQRAIDG